MEPLLEKSSRGKMAATFLLVSLCTAIDALVVYLFFPWLEWVCLILAIVIFTLTDPTPPFKNVSMPRGPRLPRYW
jgi:hypothetical protein